MCMKYTIPNNVRMVGVALLVLVAIYGMLSILVKTQEGLSNGGESANKDVIKKTTSNDKAAKGALDRLKASSNVYIDLLNSYKNNKMANGINELAVSKTTRNLVTISDYNEAIDYLKTVNSDAVAPDAGITSTIDANNTDTNNALNNLKADNQAYVDLLTSYKRKKMADELTQLMKNGTLSISDCDHVIDYLNELSGPSVSSPATALEVPTTPEISLVKM